jgi:hypothetical protein
LIHKIEEEAHTAKPVNSREVEKAKKKLGGQQHPNPPNGMDGQRRTPSDGGTLDGQPRPCLNGC